MSADEKARATTESARAQLATMQRIVDVLEPFGTTERLRIMAAVMCLESVEVAQAAIRAWERRQG